MEARVSAHSQVYRLRERMAQAEVQHGEEIRADLPGIRVIATAREWFTRRKQGGEVYFCTMGPIQVRKVAISGDGGPLPGKVTLEGLRVPDEGTYDLINVLVRSNGNLRLIVDEATRVAPAERERASSAASV